MKVFKLFILLFSFSACFSCGWHDRPESARLAYFSAEQKEFERLFPFKFSADNLFQPYYFNPTNDNLKNCEEWQNELSKNITIDDINTVLYKMDAVEFENRIAHKTKNNTFLNELLLPKNITYLEYLRYAKLLEQSAENDLSWESWETIDNEISLFNVDIVKLSQKLSTVKSKYLVKRYAFLNIKYRFYINDKQGVIAIYNKYFSTTNSKSIIDPWAMYYYALCLNDVGKSNYLLSKVVLKSENKAAVAISHFVYDSLPASMKYATNNEEKGMLLFIKCIRDPRPALNELKLIHQYIPNNPYFNFLVAREVNKLEDWILTPKFTVDGSTTRIRSYDYEIPYEIARAQNLKKDLKYLQQFNNYLCTIQSKSRDENADFIQLAIAHLCFLADSTNDGYAHLHKIRNTNNKSILLQKNIELALVNLYEKDVNDLQTQNELLAIFKSIESSTRTNRNAGKSLYSLFRICSATYMKKNNIPFAGLLFIKSIDKKYTNEYEDDDYEKYFYDYIGYFDKYASYNDMENLIDLINKKNKSNFEKYLCKETISNNINYYKDIKGTIAFRNNRLDLAYKTFAEMPHDYWETNYEYKHCLNEDPFFPKVLVNSNQRSFKYKFNKKDFVATLIKLKKQNTPESNIQLGHAYFNVSYWGNSWMMNSYSKSNYDEREYNYIDYIYLSNTFKIENDYQFGNYKKCNLAKMYYQKALKMAKNNEDKAMANIMIYECDYHRHLYMNKKDNQYDRKFRPGNELKNLCKYYSHTNTFLNYQCGSKYYFFD